jgi:ankyrin repeat protein
MAIKNNQPDAVKQAFRAVDDENVDALRRYLTGDGDENARNSSGLTLLQHAVSKNRYIAATLLLEGGADPAMKSRGTHGYTALHYAADNDNVQMIELLAKYMPDLNVTDKYRQTPLHVAAHEGNPKAVYALVKAGADMFATDRDGFTALDIALRRRGEVLDFQWQEYEDIERYLRRRMDESAKLAAAFKEAQEKKVGNDLSELKKKNPNRYKLGQ